MTISQHISHRYDEELEAVRNRVLVMGQLVENQIEVAMKGLAEGDPPIAERVETLEHEVNAHEVATDEHCSRTIGRRRRAVRMGP